MELTLLQVKRLTIILLILSGFSCLAQTPMIFPFAENEGVKTTDKELINIPEIPDINQKVVSINNGQCSGAVISKKGLVLTNYHCFFDFIYTLDSAVIHNGFYADKRKKEIPLEGTEMEVTLNAEDVTEKLLAIQGDMRIEDRIDAFLKKLESGDTLRYVIKKFEPGERYFLITYRIYQNITLVCIPPRNAANFGGQSGNWSWPRYATDFCLLRIADKDVPPLPFFETRMDFEINQKVFSLGYPAETRRSQSSFAMDYKINFENKIRNLIRNKRTQILSEELSFRPQLHSRYHSKLQEISNYNLFIQGESALFHKYGYINKAREEENSQKTENTQFISLMDSINISYKNLEAYSAFRLFLNEALVAPEIFLFAFKFNSLYELLKRGPEESVVEKTIQKLRTLTHNHFTGYDRNLDRKMFFEMLVLYNNYLPDSLKPDYLFEIKRDYDNDFYNYSKNHFDKSIFSSCMNKSRIGFQHIQGRSIQKFHCLLGAAEDRFVKMILAVIIEIVIVIAFDFK
jgi:hypothetical protein